MKLVLSLIVSCIFTVTGACAQYVDDTARVKKLLSAIDSYNSKLTPEKLYLNFDKPYYAAGDTIWFKVYLLNAASNKASAFSNKVYVELLNDSSKVLQMLVIPVSSGLGQGDIKLDGNFREGAYTIRAYTNWMQNFAEAQFFHARFYISKPTNTGWLFSEQHQTTSNPEGRLVRMGLQLKNLQGQPIVNQALTMRVLEGRKGILKNEIQTGVDGKVNANIILPPKTDTHKLSLLLQDKADNTKKITIPFYPHVNGDIDLQFMPEGGEFIAGLYNRIGFKAIGEDGLGADIEGRIVNNKGEEITSFKTTHNGMGSMAIVPLAGDAYTAKIKTADGQEKSYALPAVKTNGLVLRVDAVSNADTVRLYITGNAANGNTYTLLAQGRGTTYFGSPFTLSNGAFNTRIPKSKFPTGVVNFTILNNDGKPINARNIFIDRHDRLNVSIGADKPVYSLQDSIALNFKVTDKNNSPVQANFSVTVTDDGQVKDALRNQHIASYFLLSSELKGHIENPDWYFEDANRSAPRALDNLLLTQGWVGYDTENRENTPLPVPIFWAEANNSLEGKLSNFFNKPAAGRKVTLMSSKHGLFVIDTISNADGKFKFENLPIEDTTLYTIKIHKTNGADAAVGIKVNEFKPAIPPLPDTVRLMPWYVNTDTTLLNYLKTSAKREVLSLGSANSKGHLLKEVNIKAAKKARLQGDRGEDIYFADVDADGKEMSSHGNISLMTYLEKNVPGFEVKTKRRYEFFAVKGNFVTKIVIDSMSLAQYYLGGEKPLDFVRGVFNNMSAASVTNLVIYHKPTPDNKDWVSYIYIKTRMGTGPILKSEPGTYVYRPLPLYLPRNFYRPRYTVKTMQPDLRSTIHWEPNLVTGTDGNAKLSFYAAEQPSTYTITVEGTDMEGHFGVATGKVTILQSTAGVR